MPTPTNAQLAKDIKELSKAMTRGFDDVSRRIQPIHDFMIGQQAIASASKSGNASDERNNIIKWLILIVAGLIGVKIV